MEFILKVDCEFEADDLDDALYLLEQHFRYLQRKSGESQELDFEGSMNLNVDLSG